MRAMRASLTVLGLLASATLIACGSSSDTGKNQSGTNGTDGGGTDAGNYVAPTGAPITGAQDNVWTWVPVDGAVCRDGSPAGFGVNMNSASKNLMIYLQGGGACYNAITCFANPPNFDSSTIASAASGGVLDRTNAANPVKDWNMVFVPFCTGDVHGGTATNVTVPGVAGLQQFVGYTNMGLFLDRIVPTFKNVQHVLHTGMSAGGFGSGLTIQLVADKFPPGTNITFIDDSGPPMSSTYLPSCLQGSWRTTWGFDNSFLKDCGADCPDPNNFAIDWSLHLLKKYPTQKSGLIESIDDSVITLFYGWGTNNCATPGSAVATPVDAATFKAGLLDFRSEITAKTQNFGTYYPNSTQHTWTQGASFYTEDEGGTALVDWYTNILNGGTPTQVGGN